MAKRPNLGQISSPIFTVSQLNEAYNKIDNAFDNTLSRDGSTPNTMLADLDMNSNDILNAGVLYGTTINVDEAYIGGKLFTGTLTWRSDWLTATSYQENDLVKINGNVYVCLDEHTSGVFATDLAASRWEIFVENAEGPAGPTGADGPQGPAGQGVPTGGTTGQVLAKINATDYNTQWVTPGGVSDGDKGDITVSGSGTTWTIDNGVVSLAKMANMATSSLIYRKTAGSGDPEVNTLATLKTDLGLTGTNSGDQTITLTGAITGSGTASFATSLGSFTKAQLDTAVSDGDVLYVGDVTSNATHTGDVTGATALTIANDAVNNAKLANVATSTIKGRVTAGTGDPEDLTGTQATTLLDTFTTSLKGLAPASGGGTTNFLRADGTWAAPSGGGGSPGGSSGEIQYNNAGAFAGAADVEIEGGQLRLPSISTPTVPASGGLKVFGKDFALTPMPHVLSPSDVIPWPVQPMLGDGNYRLFLPGTGTGVTSLGWPAITGAGTATAAAVGAGNKRTNMQRIEYLVTTASTTAVASARMNSNGFAVNGGSAGEGGFFGFMHGGPSTGLTNSSHRFFMGMGDTGAPTDVEPSTLLSIVGIGWDAADSNVQFMHNDGSGTATKADLGASFAVPTTDRATIYRLRLFAPPGTTRSLSYEVTELESGAVATGTVTTNLPATSSYITPKMYSSVGGVSSVTGIAVGPWAFQTEPYA